MFAQYFGQFLLNSGLVTPYELDNAISAQKETRVKLGVLAINHGYMTAEQVEEVHQAQSRMDKKFGEIAVDLGYVDDASVSKLLDSQQSAHLALGQALIDQGIMNYEAFADALNRYKKDYSLSDEQFESIVNGSIETLVEAVLLKGGLSQERELTDYISLFAKNMIRFIDSDILMEIASPADIEGSDWIVQQTLMNGNRTVGRVTAIGGSEASLLRLASIYAQETIDEPGEMMEASVGEFLNLHNGIYLVNLSNEGVELELDPQSVIRGSDFSPSSPVKTVIHITGTELSFALVLTNLSDLT